MLVCLSVRLYPINVKTAEPIGPKFCVGPQDDPNLKYFCLKVLYFKVLIIREKNIMKSANIFLYTVQSTKRKCSQIKQQIKVEIIEKSLVIINSSNEHINSYVKIILLSLNYSGQKKSGSNRRELLTKKLIKAGVKECN